MIRNDETTIRSVRTTAATGGFRRGIAVVCLALGAVVASPAQDGQASPDTVKFKTLFSFDTGTDGYIPGQNLVQGFDGNLYGTTYAGGASFSGNVFRLTPGGAVTRLYSFCSQPSQQLRLADVRPERQPARHDNRQRRQRGRHNLQDHTSRCT